MIELINHDTLSQNCRTPSVAETLLMNNSSKKTFQLSIQISFFWSNFFVFHCSFFGFLTITPPTPHPDLNQNGNTVRKVGVYVHAQMMSA